MDANLTHSIVHNRPRQSGAAPIVVQPASVELVDLMERCHQQAYGYGPDQLDAESLTAEKFRNHLSVFPEGQFVALDSRTRQVVGTSTNMRWDFDFARDSAVSWAELTKDGWLTTHQPDGQWLYGVDTVVHPDYRSQGVGGQLIETRYNLIRRLNLRGLVAGSLIVDYGKVADQISAEQYVREVVAGLRFDSNLSKQLRKGFKVYGLIPNYTIDANSRGWAAQIVWVNPDYRPARRIQIVPALRRAGSLLPSAPGRAPLLQGI